MSFFAENPQFTSTKTDRQVEADEALAIKNAHFDEVQRKSLLGECAYCGFVGEVLLGICDSCILPGAAASIAKCSDASQALQTPRLS